MRSLGLKIIGIGLPFLAGCSLLSEQPEPSPAPPIQVEPPAPAPEPEVLPYPPLPSAISKPAPKPRPPTPPKSGKTLPGKPVPTAPNTESLASHAEGTTAASTASRPARKAAVTPSSLNGPEWLQYCSSRQQSGDAILCDANTLLAQPSAKIQVYVREPALARDTPGGKIVLREGLPKLYRFFVLP